MFTDMNAAVSNPCRAAVVPTAAGPLAVEWTGNRASRARFIAPESAATRPPPAASRWLAAYFAAAPDEQWRRIDPAGTPFQRRVWRALLEIGGGRTCTYGELARQIGQPGAARAVGRAVGANPLALLIPCHRVLPAAGGSGGYRWGAERKTVLLRAENRPGDRAA